MERGTARQRIRALALTGVLVLLAAAPAGARLAPGPRVDVQSSAGLAPDGQSIGVSVLASCPERWTVVEAVVTVTQPQASGRASFPLTCTGSLRMFFVSVPAAAGTFDLGEARIDASVVIKRGKTDQAQDSEVVDVQPTVFVELAETAQLASGGGAVTIDVTVACPVGTNGLPSRLNISQGPVSANGSYTPVCDGQRHTFEVTVPGAYQPGTAQALTFADVEHEGTVFSGVDDGPIQIVS